MGLISHLNNRRVPETASFIASGVRSRSGRWGEGSLPGRGRSGQSQGYILSRKMIYIPETVKTGSTWGLEVWTRNSQGRSPSAVPGEVDPTSRPCFRGVMYDMRDKLPGSAPLSAS